MACGRVDVAAEKRALRREAQGRIRALSTESRALASAAIVEKLLATVFYREARTLHCYISLPLEVDTAPVLLHAWNAGKAVYIPFQIPDLGRLGVAHWEPGLALVPGPLGVLEPPQECRQDELPGSIDLVVVPGLAFDRRGTRLGRGKGYYDRFLASIRLSKGETPAKLTVLAALAFSCQIFPGLPRDTWDVPVEHVLTDDEAFLTFQR